jgi:hypothetical protein
MPARTPELFGIEPPDAPDADDLTEKAPVAVATGP